MSRERKEAYKSPEVEVLDIRQEGVICASGSVTPNISDPSWPSEEVLW